jgi:hypothetical protein
MRKVNKILPLLLRQVIQPRQRSRLKQRKEKLSNWLTPAQNPNPVFVLLQSLSRPVVEEEGATVLHHMTAINLVLASNGHRQLHNGSQKYLDFKAQMMRTLRCRMHK